MSDSSNELSSKVLKQVEYYLGDSNYPNDKFLRAEAAKNPEGYITIKTLLLCNRLKTLTTDDAFVASSLKDSDVVVLNDDSTMVKRKNPLPEEDTSLHRTIYSKGWPADTTIENVSSIFSQYGKVLAVILRRNDSKGKGEKGEKTFKGSLLVEFDSEDAAKAALEAKPQIEGRTITYDTKEKWAQEKREYHQQKKEKYKKQKEDRVGEKRKADKEPENEFVGGLLVSFKDIGEDQTREDIKPIFEAIGEVYFVDFSKGATEGTIRFVKPEDAAKAVKELSESKKEIGGKVPALKLLQDEEEKQYWEKVRQLQQEVRKKGKGKRGGRGGRGGGRGGRGGFKKQKTTD